MFKMPLHIFIMFCLIITLIFPASVSAKPRDDDWNEMDCTRKVKMSASTKKRLDQIYQRIYRDYIDMIETYAQSGALTWEQKQTRLKMLKNYITKFKSNQYQWCSEHEKDEWEEEWYNRD